MPLHAHARARAHIPPLLRTHAGAGRRSGGLVLPAEFQDLTTAMQRQLELLTRAVDELKVGWGGVSSPKRKGLGGGPGKGGGTSMQWVRWGALHGVL